MPWSIGKNALVLSTNSEKGISHRAPTEGSVMKNIILLCLFSLTAVSAQASTPQEVAERPLAHYVAKVDSNYHWVEHRRSSFKNVTFAELTLISQKWRDIVWKHKLYIIIPKSVNPSAEHGLLFIAGAGGSRNMKIQRVTSSCQRGQTYLLQSQNYSQLQSLFCGKSHINRYSAVKPRMKSSHSLLRTI